MRRVGILVSFVLSGFVIGLRHRGRASGEDVRVYLQRRAVRVFPVNFFAVLLACAVAGAVSGATDFPTAVETRKKGGQ